MRFNSCFLLRLAALFLLSMYSQCSFPLVHSYKLGHAIAFCYRHYIGHRSWTTLVTISLLNPNSRRLFEIVQNQNLTTGNELGKLIHISTAVIKTKIVCIYLLDIRVSYQFNLIFVKHVYIFTRQSCLMQSSTLIYLLTCC